MLLLRFPRLWLTLGWTAVGLAILASLVPVSQLPQPGVSDKTEHFVAYLLLTLWFTGIYPRSRYWIIGVGLCVMGVLIEFAQGAMHYGRQADVLDVLANSSGIVAGLLLSWALLGGWVQRIEALFGKPIVEKQ